MIKVLFLEFFKIGLFSFGGGYGMLALMQEICIEKHKWITKEEFLNILAIAESTPGPIAVNLSTYVGYKQLKLVGAISTILGVSLPSMIVIGLISLCFDKFLTLQFVSSAFVGIRIAVSILIIDVGVKLFANEMKTTPNKIFTIFLFMIFLSFLIIQNITKFSFSSIYLILIASIIGIAYHQIIQYLSKK